jgi:hypothetical protein
VRVWVDLPEGDIDRLDALSRSRGTSRADLIRQALTRFLAWKKVGIKESFGLWKNRRLGGLEYQASLRVEWERDRD